MSRAACLVAAFAAISGSAAGAGEAEDAFNSLYGTEYARVAATRDKADDAALAAALVKAAEKDGIASDLLVILCEKAYELGSKSDTGYDAAAGAMELLAEKVPDRKGACLANILTVRQRHYDKVRGDARAMPGEVFIDALRASARAAAESGGVAQATVLCCRAVMVARAIGSDRVNDVQAQADAYAARQRAEKRLAAMKARLEANPKDAAARKELVQLWLVEMDDPARAAACLDESCDADLRKYVPAAAKPVEEAPELACLELGNWYWGLVRSATPASQPAMLERTRAYVDRFLELHTAEDVLRSKAQLISKNVTAELARIAEAKNAIGPGRWVELLKRVDLKEDILAGNWQRKETGLYADAMSRLSLPCMPEGSYELVVEFVRHEGNSETTVILPTGLSSVAFLLGSNDLSENELRDVMGARLRQPVGDCKVPEGKPCLLEIAVILKGTRVAITSRLNRRPCIQWDGPQAALAVESQYKMPTRGILGIATHVPKVTFKSVRIRMLSGKAKMLREVTK